MLTVLLMLGMGAALTPSDFAQVRRHPKALLVGLAAQLGWMPLAAAMAIRWADLPADQATSLLLMACVGGGNASNMLTYLARADVALSLSMTLTTTVLGVVTTPLLLWLHGGTLPTPLPLGAVAVTLAVMAVPVPLGMWLRAHHPARAQQLDRLGTRAGAVLLVVLIGSSIGAHLTNLATTPTTTLVAVTGVVASGMAVGMAGARLSGVPRAQALPVALEVGVQNLPVALAVLAATFPAEQQETLQRLPLLQAAVALTLGSMLVATSRWSAR